MLIKEDYCDYDTCVALKELGFDEKCHGYYEPQKRHFNITSIKHSWCNSQVNDIGVIICPTLYEAQKWLREEKKIEVNATYDNIIELHWHWYMKSLTNRNQDISIINHDSYEQALLAGIKEAVKILKDGIRK